MNFVHFLNEKSAVKIQNCAWWRNNYIYNSLFRKGHRTTEIWKWKILVLKTWTISNTPLGIIVNNNNSVSGRKLIESISHGRVDKLQKPKYYIENCKVIYTTIYISDLCVWNKHYTFVRYISMIFYLDTYNTIQQYHSY